MRCQWMKGVCGVSDRVQREGTASARITEWGRCVLKETQVKSLCVLGFAPWCIVRIFRPKCCSHSVPVWGVSDYRVIGSSELCITGQDSILLVLWLKIHVRVRYCRIPSSLKRRKVFGEVWERVRSCLQLNSVLQQRKPPAPWGLARGVTCILWEPSAVSTERSAGARRNGCLGALPASVLEQHFLPCATSCELRGLCLSVAEEKESFFFFMAMEVLILKYFCNETEETLRRISLRTNWIVTPIFSYMDTM